MLMTRCRGPRLQRAALMVCLRHYGQVTKRQVMETADDDFLEAGGLVVSAAAWHKKGIRVNTKARPLPTHLAMPFSSSSSVSLQK